MSKHFVWEPVEAEWVDVAGLHREIVSSEEGRKLTLFIPRAAMSLRDDEAGLEVELSMDSVRLCRQVPAAPTPVVPDEVREKIHLMIAGIMDSAEIDAAAETAAWEVQAWLDGPEASDESA